MMRWYVNDVSLQGQFVDGQGFESQIRGILSARARIGRLKANLFTTRTLRERLVAPTITVRDLVLRSPDLDFKRAVLGWLDRNGPFVEDDRLQDPEDYFEYDGEDITDTGLGEAARRVKARENVTTFSFAGGARSFEATPLQVEHGLDGDRLGSYAVENLWTLDQLAVSATQSQEHITSWKQLVEAARERFPRLLIPDRVYQDRRLVREPFDAVVRDRVLVLLSHLNRYMSHRQPNGAEGDIARSVICEFFTGDRALFSGESQSNQQAFRAELTFPDFTAKDGFIFAHWHGKISHRIFRLHFEWPVPAGATHLKIAYIGPKLTKS